jgi:hypothetical protein
MHLRNLFFGQLREAPENMPDSKVCKTRLRIDLEFASKTTASAACVFFRNKVGLAGS